MNRRRETEVYLHIYSRAKPGVFSRFDTVGLECGCQGDEEEARSRGTVHLARGGYVAECLGCGRVWSLAGLPTRDHGPVTPDISNPQDRTKPWRRTEGAEGALD